MTSPTPKKKKVDAFDEQVEAVGTQEHTKTSSRRGVLSLNRNAVIAGVVGVFGLFAIVVVTTTVGNDQVKRDQGQEPERPIDQVRFDPSLAGNQADQLLDDALESSEEDESAEIDVNAQPEKPAVVELASASVAQPEQPLPAPGPSAGSGVVDPWEQARAQHRAADAQLYYQQIRGARRAPMFFGAGSPSSSGRDQGIAGGDERAEDDQLEAFRSRIRQVQSSGAVASGTSVSGEPGVRTRGGVDTGASSGREREQAFFSGKTGLPGGGGKTRAGSGSKSYVEAGTMVHAVLLSRLDSTLPGQVIARVAQPVWDREISTILIPSGATLIGMYNARTRAGQARMQVAWTKLVMSDGRQIELASLTGAGFDGRSGVGARVDEHFDDLLAGAALAGIFSASAALVAGPTNALSVQPAQQALYGGAGALQSAGEGLTERALEIEPTLTVEPGARVGIMVMEDLCL